MKNEFSFIPVLLTNEAKCKFAENMCFVSAEVVANTGGGCQ